MTANSYTTFETLLLVRGILRYGFEEGSFREISEKLLKERPVKEDRTFNPNRLTPGALQERFLDLIWEQLKSESGATTRQDEGDSSPSKRRKLQPPPKPTIHELSEHLDRFDRIHRIAYGAYVTESRALIRDWERKHQEALDIIATCEDLAAEAKRVTAQEVPPRLGPATVNGVGPSPGASPRLAPTAQAPPTRPAPTPQPPQSLVPPAAAQAGPAPSAPALSQPQMTTAPRPPPSVPQPTAHDPPGTPRPGAGVSPVLQLPQGAPPFQPLAPSPAVQHPPTIPPNAQPQPLAQGQLKWEPPYQPGGPVARPGQPLSQQHIAQGPIQPSQPLPQPRPAPHHAPQPPARPLQPQVAKPLPQPVLASPQPTGHFSPAVQSTPSRPAVELGGVSASRQPLLAPNVQPGRPPLPAYQQGYPQPVQGHQTPSAAAPAPKPPAVAPQHRPQPGPAQLPPTRTPNQPLQAPSGYPQLALPPASPSPAPQVPDAPRVYNSPYPAPGSAVPAHMQPYRLPGTPAPAPPARITPVPFTPQTPATALSQRLITGSNTKWDLVATPSTPIQGHALQAMLSAGIQASPAYEPLSPVLPPASLAPVASPLAVPPVSALPEEQKRASPAQGAEQPHGTPPKRKAGRPRNPPRASDAASPPKAAAVPPAVTPAPKPTALEAPALELQAAASSTPVPEEAPQPPAEAETTRIKDEVTTPRPLTETGDTTADESVAGRRQAPRHAKRKREDLSPSPVQTPAGHQAFFEPTSAARVAEAPTEVVWTRQFNKVSGSAMEQIIHHRFANMFAQPVREKDAPGYNKVILQPQDLKSIKAAINAGNRVATQAAAALPGGDPNTSSVCLPLSEGLVPPKGIINSGQLEREFAHMFANAIMYNPDHGHGPGPSFLVRGEEAQGDEQEGGGTHGHDAPGYQVDEFGVVNDTRAMFCEVEKLLSELRSAEVRRTGGGRTLPMTGTSTRQTSVAQREASQARDEGGNNGNNGNNGGNDDEHTATEADTPLGNVAKRRRTARG
ncbi:hypothetical protein QBC34DRAFT_415170 [Podospora aff. communis PSN243]|uniref:Bromo domain-containing protein n=1 Tax=Podospora aff. communis PSN243 TaxID=3040156 RepID=A0AAV9GAV2_9PEZI|nr:hypothetical protein QBC34DRAFT_415170 [Podospora aff. communis PSN243]